jgi:hypothetical protein
MASVSERTIRAAEKNQRISCSHASYIADALGVAATQIVRSSLGPATHNGHEPSPLSQIWEAMLGRDSAHSIEAVLHRDLQIHSCGAVSGFPRPEQFFRRYVGLNDCVLFFEILSEYFYSLGSLDVRIAELYRYRSAAAIEGTVSPSSSKSSGSLRIVSCATLGEGKVQTLVNHVVAVEVSDLDREVDWHQLSAPQGRRFR